MRYIGIIILLVFCLTLLLFTGCRVNTVKPEPASGNLESQEDINQSSNNSQSSSTGPVEEPAEETKTVYPQKWATGDGTAENPWANDCIQKALNFVPAGGTIFLKAGYYTLSNQAEITKKVNIIGEGRDKTIITTADAHGFYIESVDYVTIKNLTVDGDAQDSGEDPIIYRCPITVGQSEHILLENIEAKNAARYGIDTNTMNHSSLLNIYAHNNYRHGVHSGTDVSGNNMHNTYRDIYCWDNGVCGFDDRGNETYPDEDLYNLYDNLHCWDNGEAGISITTQGSGVISNSFVSGNGIWGLNLRSIENFNIHDCSVALSGEQGIYIQYSNNLNFTNVIVKNNNNNVVDGNSGGIMVRQSNGIRFTSCQSYDDRIPPIQKYGLSTKDAVDYVELVNCKLLPNLQSAIYNVARAVLTVITEKREFLLLSL